MTNDELRAREHELKANVFDLLNPAKIMETQEINIAVNNGAFRVLKLTAEAYERLQPDLSKLLTEAALMGVERMFRKLRKTITVLIEESDNLIGIYFMFELSTHIRAIEFISDYEQRSEVAVQRLNNEIAKHRLAIKQAEEARAIALKMVELEPSLKEKCRHLLQPELYPPGFYPGADDQAQDWLSSGQISLN